MGYAIRIVLDHSDHPFVYVGGGLLARLGLTSPTQVSVYMIGGVAGSRLMILIMKLEQELLVIAAVGKVEEQRRILVVVIAVEYETLRQGHDTPAYAA